jgi:hypothetical protein
MVVSLGRSPPKIYRGSATVQIHSIIEFGKMILHQLSLTVRETFRTGTKVSESDPIFRCGTKIDQRIKGTPGITG